MLPAAATSLAPTRLSWVQPGPGVLRGGGPLPPAPQPRAHAPTFPRHGSMSALDQPDRQRSPTGPGESPHAAKHQVQVQQPGVAERS